MTHLLNRIYCRLFGCDVAWYSSAYMPDDYCSPSYCKRCGACHDVYQVETTDFELVWPVESLIGRFSDR